MASMVKPAGVNNIWAITGTKTDPGSTKANTGWVVELPPYQTANWIEFRQDSFIAHSNQHGVPEWDAVTEYQGNISYTKGSDGIIYKCLATNINTAPSNPLNSAFWVQAFEVFGSVAIVTASLNTHLGNYSTLAGIGNTAVARTNLSVYSKTEGDTRYAALVGLNTQAFSVATATLPAHAVPLSQFSSLLTQATEATAGIAQIATNAEVSAGVNDTDIVTPLKAATLYLTKAGNLAGLANVATARTNLGLGAISTMSDTLFLKLANNLSELPNKATARTNLGLSDSVLYPSNTWLIRANNLSDLLSPATARTNLGLGDIATLAQSSFLATANNLSDVPNKPVARTNLGLGTAATQPETYFNRVAQNLADVPDKAAARANLGLTAMALAVPTTYMLKSENLAGLANVATARANLGLTDSVLYPSNTWLIKSLNLGDLSNVQAARNNLGLGSLSTRNVYGVSGDLDFSSWNAQGGWERKPNGLIEQWGYASINGGNGGQTGVGLHIAMNIFNVQLTYGQATDADGDSCAAHSFSTTSFIVSQYGRANTVWWRAIGAA